MRKMCLLWEGHSLTNNHNGFLKCFILQKTKQHSPVRLNTADVVL